MAKSKNKLASKNTPSKSTWKVSDKKADMVKKDLKADGLIIGAFKKVGTGYDFSLVSRSVSTFLIRNTIKQLVRVIAEETDYSIDEIKAFVVTDIINL